MAIIRSLEPGSSNVRENRTEVDATFQVIESAQQGKLLHIATYGSDSRKSEPKVSQVLQLNKAMALQLSEIIRRTFE
ncbi:hypothetical protein ASH00_15485 [Arthrobacter sp. Soil782]|nr:hypothetical protein ASH00_15485 [Arthrobacter sp. Soil782]